MSRLGTLSLTNAQSERLDAILGDTPGLLAHTRTVRGNRLQDLHPSCPALPACSPVLGLKGFVCVIGGASRGIGQGIAVRFAAGGAKVCVLGRSDGKVSTGPGSLSDVVAQIDAVGGEGTAVQCDLSKPEQVRQAIGKVVDKYGGIDVLVNNASALYPVGVEHVDEKRFDLMNHVCVRGAFLLTREVLPHMGRSQWPHVLTVAPAPIADRSWMGPHTCYSGTKVGMGLLAAAWSEEFPRIRFNTLWPQYIVATFAVTNTLGHDLDGAVTVAHMADPAYRIVTSHAHGLWLKDSDVLQALQVADTRQWQVAPDADTLVDDFMTDPLSAKAGQAYTYRPLAASDLASLGGLHVLLVSLPSSDRSQQGTAAMAMAAERAGAIVHRAELTADLATINAALAHLPRLDRLFISAGASSALGTLETSCALWEATFLTQCKAPYFYVARSLPLLRKSKAPCALLVAPSPSLHPVSYGKAVPCAVHRFIRSLYILGMAEEFDGSAERRERVAFNGIYDGSGEDPPAQHCLAALAPSESPPASGEFYAPDVEAIPEEQRRLGERDYRKGALFVDYTSTWLAEAAVGDVG